MYIYTQSVTTLHKEICYISPTHRYRVSLLKRTHVLQRAGQAPVIPEQVKHLTQPQIARTVYFHESSDGRIDLGRLRLRRERGSYIWECLSTLLLSHMYRRISIRQLTVAKSPPSATGFPATSFDGAGEDAVLPNPLKPDSLDMGLS